MGLLKAFFSAIAAIWQGKNAAANRANTPEMQANARAKQDAAIREDARETLKTGDIEDLRKKL